MKLYLTTPNMNKACIAGLNEQMQLEAGIKCKRAVAPHSLSHVYEGIGARQGRSGAFERAKAVAGLYAFSIRPSGLLIVVLQT